MAPLRDRPPSNTTEPEWPPQSVTPLRIAKRDTPQRQHASQLSRRSSNTFAKLTHSNLVSQSPFRSQSSTAPVPSRPSSVSAPSPRRVSGEKRPRPDSMQSHVENERPLGFKRRQSKGFQDLIEREPVTKSPFRRPTTSDEDPFPPPPPPMVTHISHLPTPSSSASPGRSSLVSKRLHGPRLIGHDVPKRQRRKRVTFYETCDVVTFERDDSLEDELFSDDYDDDYGETEGHEAPEEANDSITGLVDSMIQDARDASNPQTPPMDRSLPPHMDSENGVPYGRTHHADRVALSRQSHPTPPLEIPETLTSISKHSPSIINTPPQGHSMGSFMPLGRSTHSERARADRMPDDVEEDVRMLPPSPSPAKNKRYPFGDHSESLLPQFDLDAHLEEVEDIAGSGRTDPLSLPEREDVHIVELSFMSSEGAPGSPSEKSSALQQALQPVELEELGLDTSNSQIQTSTPPLRLKSPGGSLGKSIESPNLRELPRPPRSRSESPLLGQIAFPIVSHSGSPTLASRGSPSFHPTSGSPVFAVPTHVASTFSRGLQSTPSAGSLSSRGSIGSLSRRNPRPDREDVHKHLLRKRSADSPVLDEIGESPLTVDNWTKADITDVSVGLDDVPLAPPGSLVPLPLHKDGTYDGVMSIDPDPQPVDPPRPSIFARAKSETEVSGARGTAGLHSLDLDVSNVSKSIDLGLGAPGATRVEINEVKSALERLVQSVVTDSAAVGTTMSARPSPQDLKMKGSHPSLKVAAVTNDEMPDYHGEVQHATPNESTTTSSRQRTPELLSGGGFVSPSLSRNTSESSNVLQSLQKDAIRHREQMILEKRREMRRREQDEDMGYVTPPRNTPQPVGRQSGRRSMSTGDAEVIQAAARLAVLSPSGSSVLPDVVPTEEKDPLAESIARELRKLRGSTKSRYHIRQHSETIYASSDADKVSHINGAGDVDSGKAWRTVRRPSDMNEYAKQIREYRSQEKPSKSHGKVFVRVLHVKGLNLPFPLQKTVMTCTLNNGIHFVTTPECNLENACRIEQEFELIEHSKLEFTLTLKVRRDPHIVAQFKANTPAPVPPLVPAPPASKGGMRSFFSSSPRKPSRVVQPAPIVPAMLEENLARYLKPDGTLARAFVSFKDIATHCDTRLFETSYPLIGQRLESGSKVSSLEIGELVLQFFRLPPLPGIPSSQLPQSLDECHRGLRHVHWHKMTYFEGTLTQSGGDCPTWRRRQFRVIGANLVAFNDVTKRATVTIDLRKAVAVEDIPNPRDRVLSPSSAQTSLSGFDEYEGLYGVERSFRLRFQRNLDILFFTDTDEEKEKWLEVLRALIGRIPPNHLWAELLWQRQQELTRHPSTFGLIHHASTNGRTLCTPHRIYNH
ncbi:hypothetical protein B0F90DRAFT_1925455 [Multifurca ochricompacta]|uniref:PH domain-containing protein n=1 Tax=Multifurca ochricompacta TaxID=376703 RepID=A0AAD4QNW0_9AGAM|nr:hypothetical protein B0F90DRAFT_1925455 [Multifurca ochricompacta]